MSRSGLLAKAQLLNDNYTPMEFVVYVLEHVFEMEHEPAVRLMLEIHREGAAMCGVYPYDVAQTKVTEVLDFARSISIRFSAFLKEAHQSDFRRVLDPRAPYRAEPLGCHRRRATLNIIE